MFDHLIDLVVPRTTQEFWTSVEGLAGVVVVVAAIRGLKSLKAVVAQAMREGRTCAIHRCEEWATKVIPRNGEIYRKLAEGKVALFVPSLAEVKFESEVQPALASRANVWWDALPPDVPRLIVEHMNALEAWSMYFTSGVADRDLAFGPCAPTYVTTVGRYYAFLLVMRSGQGAGKFPNTVLLFQEWYHKLDRERKAGEMKRLDEQMKQLQSKGPGVTLPPMLGTDL